MWAVVVLLTASLIFSLDSRRHYIAQVDTTKQQLVEVTKFRDRLTQDNEELQRQVNRGIFELLALSEFTNVLGTTSNLEELLNLVVEMTGRVVAYDCMTIVLLNEETQRLEHRAQRGVTDEIKKVTLGKDEGVGGWVMTTGQPRLVRDVLEDPLYLRIVEEGQVFRSLLSVPLTAAGKTFGLLNVAKYAPDTINADELRMMLVVANQAAFAIQNATLYGQIHQQAITDGLTGIFNHRYFHNYLGAALEEARLQGRPMSILMIDIDLFKAFNDSYGHRTGDYVLHSVAQVIQNTIRRGDLVARYGGEEFAVILDGADTKAALDVAERVRYAIGDQRFEHEGELLGVTVTIGVATYPQDALSLDALISRADQQLYQGKDRGRNQVNSCAN